MIPHRFLPFVTGTLCVPLLSAQAPQHTVVPASAATTDAISHLWLPGASRDVRQQTLVGSSHLAALVGRTLTALEWRRSSANETYQGGAAQWTVTLSIAARQPSRADLHFANNVGSNAVQVFAGSVTLPNSPPAAGPVVPWSANNTVRVEFTTPFVYTGGPLCVDITGLAVPGQNADWWMADAAFEDLYGDAVERGDGCGSYGGAQGRWSHVSTRDLVPGCHAQFHAYGPPGGLAIAAFGSRSPAPIPLAAFGLPAPGCALHLATLDALLPTVFEPQTHPLLQAMGGCAEVRLWIPDDAAMFGVTMTTQWFDWSQLATSNAIEWTVGASLPTLDMAVIEGHPTEAIGVGSCLTAHVLRFEHQ